MTKIVDRFARRAKRVRNKISGTMFNPRLSFHRGLRYLYAQIIDDTKGKTLVSSSTLHFKQLKYNDTIIAAKLLGQNLAKQAINKGIKQVVLDRKGYRYLGKIKVFAETLRNNGLQC
jgi:large subunit ribosomal protein L18